MRKRVSVWGKSTHEKGGKIKGSIGNTTVSAQTAPSRNWKEKKGKGKRHMGEVQENLLSIEGKRSPNKQRKQIARGGIALERAKKDHHQPRKTKVRKNKPGKFLQKKGRKWEGERKWAKNKES